MIAAEQDVFLETRVLHLLEVKKHVLSNGLNRILLARPIVTQLRKEHLSKGAFAKKRLFLKVFKLAILVLLISESYHDGLTLNLIETTADGLLRIAIAFCNVCELSWWKVFKVCRGLRLILERQLFNVAFSLLFELLVVFVFSLDLLIE